VFKSNKLSNAFHHNWKRTFEDLLPWYCYAINTNTRKNSLPSLATQSEHEWIASSPLHDTRTLTLAVVQCECHTGKYSGIAKILSIDQNWATNFMFSREFWCLVSISRGGNARFPPLRTSMVRSDDEIMHKFWSLESQSWTSGLESRSRSFWKSQSRFEILTRSRSRKLMSRLHHWNAKWTDNPTRPRLFIPDTGSHPPERPSQEELGPGLTASARVSGVTAHVCTNGVWLPLWPVSVAQKNKPSIMLSSNVQSIELRMDCTAWRFWTMI